MEDGILGGACLCVKIWVKLAGNGSLYMGAGAVWGVVERDCERERRF